MYLFLVLLCIRGSRAGTLGPDLPPLENRKSKGIPINTGPDSLKIPKATISAFNIGPLSADQRWCSAFIGIWILSPLISYKKVRVQLDLL